MNRRYLAVTGFIAAVAAVISYRDGLFVARLAGNHDDQAWLYPFLPDGLIVVCLLALYEASRAKVPRSRWAMCGLVLGITLTLAQNVYAGLAHTVLDAVLDGMVPVVFFIAVEVVLWHVRHGRQDVAGERSPTGVSPGSPATTPASVRASLPKPRQIQRRRNCNQETARKARAEVELFARNLGLLKDPPAGAAAVPPAAAPPDAPAGVISGSPAGMQEPRFPAGVSNNGRDPHG